jgi:hypothetical protein
MRMINESWQDVWGIRHAWESRKSRRGWNGKPIGKRPFGLCEGGRIILKGILRIWMEGVDCVSD